MTGMVDNLRKNASSRFKVAGIVYQHMVGQMRQRYCGPGQTFFNLLPLLPAALLKPAAQNVAPRGYFHHQQGADATGGLRGISTRAVDHSHMPLLQQVKHLPMYAVAQAVAFPIQDKVAALRAEGKFLCAQAYVVLPPPLLRGE